MGNHQGNAFWPKLVRKGKELKLNSRGLRSKSNDSEARMGPVSEICEQEKKKFELNSNQNNFLPLTLMVCGIHTHLGRGRERYSCNTSFFASAKKSFMLDIVSKAGGISRSIFCHLNGENIQR